MNGNHSTPQGPPPPEYFQQQPWGQPPKPPQNPVDLWWVFGMNLGIFLAYQALFAVIATNSFLIADILPLLIHWMVMLIFMIKTFAHGQKMKGFGWLLSLIVIVIIGFGSCWWISDAIGGWGL